MSFILEIDAYADAAGTISVPRLIGPFDSADHALTYLNTKLPRLWGTWSISLLQSPELELYL